VLQPSGGKASALPEGIFIAVVGPSGAGKDTLLTRAAEAFPDRGDMLFVRRVITRPSDGVTEDHDTLSVEAFEKARQGGAFSVSWGAHGLHYGLPAAALHAVKSGHAVIANVSRASLSDCLDIFGKLAIVEITVAEATLAERIARRGRESGPDALQRIRRSMAVVVPAGATHIRIDNSGAVEAATQAFVAALSSLAPLTGR